MKYLVMILAIAALVAGAFAYAYDDDFVMRWSIFVGFVPLALMAFQIHLTEKRGRKGGGPGPLTVMDMAVLWTVVAAGVMAAALPANGQTAIGGPRVLGGSSSAVPTPAPQTPVTAVPVPDSMVRQATDQAEGKFTTMKRGAVGGQIQEAWDGDQAKGTFKTPLCNDCEYKVRTREFMVTLIELPTGEQIASWDNGDTENFEVVKRGDRRLAVRPQGFGIDTNLIIYGKSGMTYAIYIRTESVNSKNVPDLRFVIEGHVRVAKPAPLADEPDATTDESDPAAIGQAPAKTSSKARPQGTAKPLSAAAMAEAAKAASTSQKQPDYVQTASFNPDKLRGWGNYSLRGSNELKPESVFRDDYFTYIRFGEKWKDIELPTAYVVVDGIDETVNSRVNGTTLVVESTQKLITLKSGLSHICIEYRGS